jgi:hypothetical protein
MKKIIAIPVENRVLMAKCNVIAELLKVVKGINAVLNQTESP